MGHKRSSCLTFLNGVSLCCQAGLELLGSRNPPTSIFAFQTLGLQGRVSLLPRLECRGMIIAHCSDGLLGSSEPSTSAPQVYGATGMCQHTQQSSPIFCKDREGVHSGSSSLWGRAEGFIDELEEAAL
ncbi:hypothetical protein AAY473_016666 [Plecturocebus cupreus]